MNEAQVLELVREGIFVMVKVAAPVLLVGMAVGLVVSLFQALTQIQEMTLTFVPKVLSGFIALIVFLPFMLGELREFTIQLMDRIVGLE